MKRIIARMPSPHTEPGNQKFTVVVPRLFWGILLGASMAVFLIPSARPKVILLEAKGLRDTTPVIMPGNSIIDHVSPCDTDRRTLSEMLGDDLQTKVMDYSYGGQPLAETIAYAGTALKNKHSRVVIVPVSLVALSGFDDIDLQQYLLYRLLTPSLAWESLPSRAHSGSFLQGRDDPYKQPFSYKGTTYPDYNRLKATFEKETVAEGCPEGDGADKTFVEAYYDHSYLGYTLQPKNIELLASLEPAAQAQEKQLYILLMPLDYELMDQLRAGMGEQAKERAASVAATLRAHGLTVIDLSASLHNAAFADHYCACGHLQESGRQAVAKAVADFVDQHENPASGAH